MQNSTKRINLPYWRLRTFNEKLNASIAFLKQYWKPLFKANLLVGGPLFILGVGLIVYNGLVFGNNLIANPDDPGVLRTVILFFNLFIGLIFYGFSILAITMITLEFMKVQHYHPERMDDLNFIFQNTRKRFLKMFGFTLFGLFVNYLVGLISQLLLLIVPFLGVVGIVIFVPLYFFVRMALFAYVYVIGPTAYYEKISFSKTIEQGLRFIKGNFWQTLGMYLGARIIQYIILFGFMWPLIVAMWFFLIFAGPNGIDNGLYEQDAQRYVLYVTMALIFVFTFLNLFTNIFHVISGAVQYHSLKEKKENNYINTQIDQFNAL